MTETTPRHPPGTPEYEHYRTELRAELTKFANGEAPYPYPVTEITRLPARGQTTVTVTPPRPCALDGCVAELDITVRHDRMRVHLDDDQRNQLIEALGGTAIDLNNLTRDARIGLVVGLGGTWPA